MYAVVLTENYENGFQEKLVVLFNANSARQDQRAIFDTLDEAWACLQEFRRGHSTGNYAVMDANDVCDVIDAPVFIPRDNNPQEIEEDDDYCCVDCDGY